MRNRRLEQRSIRWVATSAAIVVVGLALATTFAFFSGTPVGAYVQYSTNQADNCAACHGDFRLAPYVSAADGVGWVGGTSLHNGHRTNMLSGDCDVCHSGSTRFPVLLGSSNGGSGFPALGCIGCHGRAEPAVGGAVRGSGLRQHHYRSGVTLCANSGCHTDANPATFTTAPETVKPPYYFTPDAVHPSKPTDPCNVGGSESLVAPPRGLDNDGDLAYDANDSDCGNTAVEDAKVLRLELESVRPNPFRGGLLSAAFALPTSARARLEVLDIAGRRVIEREVGSLGAGRHVVDLVAGRPLSPGLYLVRLTQGASVRAARLVVLK